MGLQGDKMKKVVLHVSGVVNLSSAVRVEKQLKKNPKIKDASMELKDGCIIVLCKEDLPIDEIELVIENLGYESLGVELISNLKKPNIIPFIPLGILLLIILYFTMATIFHLPLENLWRDKTKWLFLGISTIVFIIFGSDILWKGLKNIIHGRSTLNSFATLSVLFTSVYGFTLLGFTYFGRGYLPNYRYLEIVMFFIYFMKIGEFIDSKNKYSMEVEINQISKTKLDKVNRKEDTAYREITMEDARENDRVLCLPGDKALLDGTLVSGLSHFDETMVTGGGLPVEKKENSKIIAGSVNFENEIEYSVDKCVKDSTLAVIKKQVAEELVQKPFTSKRMDRVCRSLGPIALIVCIVIGILNYMITHNIDRSITKALTIFILSCPFGFALATPLSFQKQLKNASKKKLFIKKMETLEQARRINTVIFDKTGTLTNGFLSVARINNHSDKTDKELLELLGSIEKHSTHALARGITKYLRSEKITVGSDLITEDLPGYGVKAKDNENIYYACNSELLDKLDIINSYKEEERKLRLEGNSVIYLTKNSKVIATFGLRDIPKRETKKVINSLKERNLDVILLTGDDEITATKIAKELEIEKVIAGRNPQEKVAVIKKLLKEGKKMIMVGDGINDAPALAASTIGVAIKNASDIPTSASDVIMGTSNLFRLLDLFQLSKSMLHYVKQNITISLLFSLIGIVISLGFIPGIKMNFILLLLWLIGSSLLVIINTIRIRNK